jgi:hypothetical protein
MQMYTADKYRRFMTTDKLVQSSETALPDSIQYTDRWTPGQTDRPTDRQTVSRNVTVLDFTRFSNGKTGADGRQDHYIRSVGRSELLVRYVLEKQGT